MSHPKKDRLFLNKKSSLTDAQLARMIAAALHQDFGGLPSSIKHIGLQTVYNLRSIKNWFQARHAPSACHLLTLAQISPSVLKLALEHMNVPLNVPIKSTPANLNERQRWFLDRLRSGIRATARSIRAHAGVTLKTARRDIAHLKGLGLICFVGAKKKGYYTLV